MNTLECKELFGLEDLKDLPESIMTVLFGDINKRNEVYRDLLRLNNYDVSYDWFQAPYEEELAERGQKKQDYTPNSLGRLASNLTSQSGWLYEPTAGNGSMVIADWWQRSLNTLPFIYRPSGNMVCCWELSARSIPLLLLNLSIRGIMGYVYHGDVLEQTVKAKYILLNREDDHLTFSEIIKDDAGKMKIHRIDKHKGL